MILSSDAVEDKGDLMYEDEIIFSGRYKDFSLGVHYDLTGKGENEVSAILGRISSEIEPYAFAFSGIDAKAIDDYVKPDGNGIGAVYSYIENNSSAWNKWAKASLKDSKLMPAADSYMFNRLLEKAGVQFKVSMPVTVKPAKEEASNVIGFIGKYKEWMAVKKLSTEKAKDYEISGILSGINFTVVNKAFDFAGVKKKDDVVASATKGKRKSYGNAVSALREIEADPDPYVVCKVLETLGYRPYASPHMLTDAYPDIKPPKVKGRKPKG